MNKLGKVASVLIGKKRPYAQNTISAINKQSQSTRQQITELGILGDEQGDPIFHGGVEKAIHIYPSEHYEYWREELGIKPIFQSAGAFGENISSVGLTESDICINDVILIGTTLLQVSQGRMPCWKLNVRCEEPEMALKLQETLKTGWYFRVLKEGDIGIGDDIVLQMRSYPNWSLSRIMKIIYDGSLNSVVLKEMIELPLVDSWNKLITKRIELGEVENWDHRLYG
jgi:MOSC domain-containing protein YiiM